MKLYLVRHGSYSPSDPARALSPAGRDEVNRVAALLRAAREAPAAILHSGMLRAKQTAEILGAALSCEVGESAGLAPGDPVADLAAEMSEVAEDLMLVGHLPHLGRLASLLVTGKEAGAALEVAPATALGLRRFAATTSPRFALSFMVGPGLLP